VAVPPSKRTTLFSYNTFTISFYRSQGFSLHLLQFVFSSIIIDAKTVNI